MRRKARDCRELRRKIKAHTDAVREHAASIYLDTTSEGQKLLAKVQATKLRMLAAIRKIEETNYGNVQ